MTIKVPFIGSSERAEELAVRTERGVPAYGEFLRRHGWAGGAFASRPIMDKASYFGAMPFAARLADGHRDVFSVIASSGSGGHATYWPQLRKGQEQAGARLREFLELAFGVHRRPTIAVVGLALGSWIGGDMISWALKNAALTAPYPMAVFVPGSRHEEILGFLRDAESMIGADGQFVLFVCPSAIGHLHLLAESTGIAFPHARVRYAVLGEAFPEEVRHSLRRSAGMTGGEAPILSVYGSADTGVLGAESPASALARRALHEHPDVSERLGLGRAPPHLFHVGAADALIETVEGEVCVTRWQGVPLVRYNLHDRGETIAWSGLREALISDPSVAAGTRSLLAATPAALPDILAIFGRADRCLILCGTNLSEDMLDAAVRGAGLDDALTGLYRASLVHENGRQRLAIELELKPAVDSDASLAERAYAALTASLGRAQPEFADDWNNVYKRWDGDPARRILRLTFCPWPNLSRREDGTIKNRGVRA